MTDDRIAGTVRNIGGKVQEGVGKVTGDTTTEVKGVMNQAAGAVQDAYGKTADAAMEGAQSVKEAAIEGHDIVRKFVEDNFLFREDRASLSDAESLLEAGLIDSTGILELVAFLEQQFQIRMADADIVPENLDSIKTIVVYVESKLKTRAAA